MNIKEKIKKLLLNNTNISTIAALERASSLSNGTINKWDKATPNIESAKKVASILNVSVDYLLGNTDEMMPNKKESAKNEMNLDEALEDRGMVMKYQGKEISDKAKKAVLSVLDLLDEED